jgi:hypothetical protein
MQQSISSIVNAGWRTVTVAVVAVIAALFLFVRPPATAQASQPQTNVMGAAAAEYVSSDPSLPSAASVKFAEPEPLPPTF